jgi:uncharacterized protein YggE
MSLFLAPTALADTTTPTTLHVDGAGSVMVRPDLASLEATVIRTEPTSSGALSDANRRIDAIVAAVRHLGVPASGIQTDNVQVYRHRKKVGPAAHKHRITVYTANESVSVTSTASSIGRVIDAATHAGATSIDGPSFSFSDPSAGVVAATNAALADARTRADAAAKTLGYTVTGVQSVDLDPGSGEVFPGGASGSASTPAAPQKSVPTTVHNGPVEVDASVSVVYTIAATPT